MKLNIAAYGIARDILGSRTLELDVKNIKNIADLKNIIVARYPKFYDLKHFSLAVGDEYREDDFVLNDNDEVVIIPPVSGG